MKKYLSNETSTQEYISSMFNEKNPSEITTKFYIKLLDTFYEEESENELIDTEITNNHFYYEECIPDHILKYKTKK